MRTSSSPESVKAGNLTSLVGVIVGGGVSEGDGFGVIVSLGRGVLVRVGVRVRGDRGNAPLSEILRVN